MSSERKTRAPLLKEKLDELYLSYDCGYIDSDPVQFPHRFDRASDTEVAAFIASALAYGNVASIKANLEKVFSALGPSPYDTLLSIQPAQLVAALSGFKHRFTTARHLSWFLLAARAVISKYGSLKALFLEGHDPEAPNIKQALTSFVDGLVKQTVGEVYSDAREAQEDGALFLLPSPRSGGACKRLNLFLRWMVRSADRVDLGLWPEVRSAQLVIPLDTHVVRLSRYLGLTQRKASDWRTAEDITDSLRELDPVDPLKYDFSLTRLGILGDCSGREGQSRCGECLLVEICSREVAVA
ncbi:MAG: TIGR02757 family protein [Candidatus Eiseniibacteriota bacterium]|nr:MAG: TIGR02757 family protein [Candidatus Eisenbacteria bacterium]